MSSFPTERLVLEGCDLCGKSSLYRAIHKISDYRWNIQDRSALSMLVHAEHYKRDNQDILRSFWSEVTNLNNRIVLLTPSWQTVKSRFEKRGDEIQDLTSLEDLWVTFDNYSWLGSLPNVLCLDTDSKPTYEIASVVKTWLESLESQSLDDVTQSIQQFVRGTILSPDRPYLAGESYVQFDWVDTAPAFYPSDWDLFPADEISYYNYIRTTFLEKLSQEIQGFNPHMTPQDSTSRRFIYSGFDCISMIQVLQRGPTLQVHVVFRSSNVVAKVTHDLRFIRCLISEALSVFPATLAPPYVERVEYHVKIHSAHLQS